MPATLTARLAAQIRASGPLTIAQFMTACLHDPACGYYATRPALGPQGDFITAPLVSQMFGELIGLWAVETWRGLGRPRPFRLIEAGPGDGTLMADLLRAARLDPDFLAAADLWLVETSGPLITAQRQRLAQAPLAAHWTSALADVPGGAPILLVANELLDCLPARQFTRTARGWAERMVGLDATGGLSLGLSPCPPGVVPDLEAPQGAVVEISAAQAALGGEIGARIARDGGTALLIDYGRDRFETGDTLQALSRHLKVDPLATAGEADLTVHADFPAVIEAARAQGAAASLTTQGAFLRRLGIEARAGALAHARPDLAPVIARQLARLTDADQMGRLFKAACLHPPGPPPPGFEDLP